MTFSVIVPNASQSPGLFPAQNNTNFLRLQTIQAADHVFNDTAAANDGTHLQVTLTNRVDPTTVPAGTNSILYGKTATDAVNELWFYDNVAAKQLNWRELDGTVTLNGSSFTTIATVPANCFGYIFMFIDKNAQPGVWVSDSSLVWGFATVEKFEPSTNLNYIVNFAKGSEASGLNLMGKTNVNTANDINLNATWTYKLYYRHQ
jgi:hypothetical protein